MDREMGGSCNVIHALQSLEDAGDWDKHQLKSFKCSTDLLEPAGGGESINGERWTLEKGSQPCLLLKVTPPTWTSGWEKLPDGKHWQSGTEGELFVGG